MTSPSPTQLRPRLRATDDQACKLFQQDAPRAAWSDVEEHRAEPLASFIGFGRAEARLARTPSKARDPRRVEARAGLDQAGALLRVGHISDTAVIRIEGKLPPKIGDRMLSPRERDGSRYRTLLSEVDPQGVSQKPLSPPNLLERTRQS